MNQTTLRPAHVLFADGSAKECALGWGVMLWSANRENEVVTLSGGDKLGTGVAELSEVAEWRAACEALTLLGPQQQPVWLLSDCTSVVAFLEGLSTGSPRGVEACIERVGPKLVYGLAHLAMGSPQLRALKVKGHAGSHGNTVVDKLAAAGRGERQARKGVLPLTDELENELGMLLTTCSTDYSFTVPVGTPDLHVLAMAARRRDKTVHKLPGDRIHELTKGMRFELSPQEQHALRAQAQAMHQRADNMPKKTAGQKKSRAFALGRADQHVKTTAKKLLQAKRKAAALQLANAGESNR